MRVVTSVEELALAAPVLAIGNFDGVHRGHRALLSRTRAWAREETRPSGIVTFFPPAKVVFQGASFLTSREEKLALLEAFAPDAVAVVPFDRDYARTPKEAFLEQLGALAPRAIVVGEDFRFGRDRAGGLDDLQHVPERLEVFGLEREDGAAISSSRIREHLARGEIADANRLLGAPYLAIGRVVEGDRRGRTIGFPTANLEVPAAKALPHGVFAVDVETPGGRFGGMANVGARPSFEGRAPAIEAHLFDFSGDLYGTRLAVRFRARLRGQRRFEGLDDLTAQLEADRAAAVRALAEAPRAQEAAAEAGDDEPR
jgi:riboflavin kinase/FMN adenylyltransferase